MISIIAAYLLLNLVTTVWVFLRSNSEDPMHWSEWLWGIAVAFPIVAYVYLKEKI